MKILPPDPYQKHENHNALGKWIILSVIMCVFYYLIYKAVT